MGDCRLFSCLVFRGTSSCLVASLMMAMMFMPSTMTIMMMRWSRLSHLTHSRPYPLLHPRAIPSCLVASSTTRTISTLIKTSRSSPMACRKPMKALAQAVLSHPLPHHPLQTATMSTGDPRQRGKDQVEVTHKLSGSSYPTTVQGTTSSIPLSSVSSHPQSCQQAIFTSSTDQKTRSISRLGTLHRIRMLD